MSIKKIINGKINSYIKKTAGIPYDKKEEAFKFIFPSFKTWNLPAGDYLEFGVYRGRAFIEAYKYAVNYGFKDMKFYAFDSFKGLPEVRGKDAEYDHFHKGQYACTEKEFLESLEKAGVDTSRVRTIPGYFNETLKSELKKALPIKRAGIVWIDCDIYESTVPVLSFITDYLTSGTFIVFDDWFSFGADPHAGEIRAAREWLEANKDITLEYYRDFGTSGRIFLVQKW